MSNKIQIGEGVLVHNTICRVIDVLYQAVKDQDIISEVEVSTPRGNLLKVSPLVIMELDSNNFIILVEMEFRALLDGIWYQQLTKDYKSKKD